MKFLALVCLLGALVTEGFTLGYHEDIGIPEASRIRQNEASAFSSRIIGGMPSASGENPYLAGLLITLTTGQMSVCGGTLLSSTKVLTAAQCWYDGYKQGRKIQVSLGSTRLFGGWARDVTAISIHPGFNPSPPASNDLAMLTLSYSVTFNTYIQPALLPTAELVNETFVGVSAKVSGFGKTSDWASIGPNANQQAVTVPVIDRWTCYSGLNVYSDKVICTSGTNGWGACGGDVGGPLILKDFYNGNTNGTLSDLLIGVTSIISPYGCANGFPVGYMRVTAYLSWIESNL